MQVRHRFACLSAAVFAALYGGAQAQARDLVWGPDVSGSWNTTDANWIDATATPSNVTFSSAIPDSATLGNATTASTATTPNYLTLTESITVQNLTFGVSAGGAAYNVQDDFSARTLTLKGNVAKVNATGTSQIAMFGDGSQLALSADPHVFAIRDTSGNVAELTVNATITGVGGITLDNGAANDAFGTLLLNFANTYQGVTNIAKGRLVITDGSALGSAAGGTTIGDLGTLSFGGTTTTLNTPVAAGDMTVAEAITITRNTYTGGAYANNPAAIISPNDGNFDVHTFTGPIVVDSTDARVRADTNRIVIAGSLAAGANTGANSVFTADGDFAGFVVLTGDNTAFGNAGGAIRIRGGVELEATSEANLGGPNSKLQFGDGIAGNFNSGTFHPVGGFLTSFGTHQLNNTTFSGGIDVDAGKTFTVNQDLGQTAIAIGSIGKRGAGTLNLDSTINLRGGQTFWDAGVVNVNGSTTLANLHLRSPTVNINNGASVTLTGGYSSLGQDSTGTAGGPDIATVNLNGTGSLFVNNGDDFNVSDNANTKATINLNGTGTISVNGPFWMGKGAGTVATINQFGGTVNANKIDAFSLAIGSLVSTTATATGVYDKRGGTLNVNGEMWVGNENGGNGTFKQSGGDTNVKNWFAVGRFGADATVDISAGTVTKTGNGNAYVGERSTSVATMTIRGTGAFVTPGNEFWVANDGGTGTLDIKDNGSLTVSNNWLAVGRNNNALGVLNLSDNGKLTKAGGGNFILGGGSGNGTVNQTGGTLTSNSTWLSEGGTSLMNLSGGTASLGTLSVGRNGSRAAELRIGGTAAVTAGDVTFGAFDSVASTLNLNGGSLTANSFVAGANHTGARNFNLNGGTVRAAVDSTNFIGSRVTSIVRAGGAKFDTNGKAVTVNSVLTHEAALGATADGGLTKSGAGTLTLTTANTYTGGTTVSAGTLVAANANALGAAPAVSVTTGGTLQVAPTVAGVGVNTLAVTGTGKVDLTKSAMVVRNGSFGTINSLVQSALVNGGNYDWNGSGIGSSNAAARAQSDGATGVGVIKNDDTGYASFRGVTGLTGSANEILVAYSFNGDSDLDADVDGDDYLQFISGYQSAGHAGTWVTGDYDYNSVVNGDDFLLFVAGLNAYKNNSTLSLTAAQVGALYSQFTAGTLSFNALVSQVPEPTSVVAGVAGLAVLGGRRRRGRVVARA